MTLKKNETTLRVETNRSMYLFLNGRLVLASDYSDGIWAAKQNVLNTLVILGMSYKKEVSLYEDEEGYMHEVTEITA